MKDCNCYYPCNSYFCPARPYRSDDEADADAFEEDFNDEDFDDWDEDDEEEMEMANTA